MHQNRFKSHCVHFCELLCIIIIIVEKWGKAQRLHQCLVVNTNCYEIVCVLVATGIAGMGNHTSAFVRREGSVEEHVRHGDGKTNRRLGNPRRKSDIERRTGGRGRRLIYLRHLHSNNAGRQQACVRRYCICFFFQGVQRVVEELERKKQLILSIVMKDHDKYVESSEAITTFSENYNKVSAWQHDKNDFKTKGVPSCTALLLFESEHSLYPRWGVAL